MSLFLIKYWFKPLTCEFDICNAKFIQYEHKAPRTQTIIAFLRPVRQNDLLDFSKDTFCMTVHIIITFALSSVSYIGLLNILKTALTVENTFLTIRLSLLKR